MACKEIQIVLYILIAGNIILPSQTFPNETGQLPLHIRESSSRLIYNLTHLIYEYYLVCGPQYICDKQHYSFITEFESNIKTDICPECQCDKHCIIRRDCCPDVMFSMPEDECVTTSLTHDSFNRKSNHYVVVECHDNSSKELKEKCTMNYTDIESLQFPPVTSAKYTFSFRNKFCAECNGIYNYTEWKIDVSCFDFVDLNFLSSYDALFNTAKSKDCQLEYKTDPRDMHKCHGTFLRPTGLFEPLERWCNVTGTWAYYDRDIESACSNNYKLSYKNHRNIFCFICNPPDYFVEDELIDTCNESGIWSPYDVSIERGCNRLDWTPNTQPYKNIFCFLCNRNNTNPNQYFDVTSSMVEGTSRYYTYYVTLSGYNLDFYHSVLEKSKTRMYLSQIHEPMSLLQKAWNTTKLVSYHYAIDGVSSYCEDKYSVYEKMDCSCDMKTCLFRERPPFCCFDILLKAPTACFNDFLVESSLVEQQESKPYGAVNQCRQQEIGSFIDESQLRCGISTDDIFGTLPVTHGNSIYKNFDCMWCHLNSFEMEQKAYMPWHVQIECGSEINARFHVMLNDLIKTAKSMDCAVRIFPRDRNKENVQMSQTYCESSPVLIEKCNVTGVWMELDPDIQSACESWGKFLPPFRHRYKNVFCFLCNNPSSLPKNDSINKCSVPSEDQYYGESIIELCNNLPMVPGFQQYKNVFCSLCSNINMTIMPPFLWRPRLSSAFDFDPPKQPRVQPSLRDMFSPRVRGPQLAVEAEIQILTFANDEEIYNTLNNKTRRLTCYPGKVLTNKTCKPLLKRTNNLRYTVAVSLEGNVTLTMSSQNLLEMMMRNIKDNISRNVGRVSFDSFHIMVNMKCDHVISNDTEGLKFTVHTTFLISDDVDRLFTEQTLLNLTNNNYVFENVALQSSVTSEAFMLPTLVNAISFMNHCYSKTIRETAFSLHNNYQTSLVSPLLLCRQVELEEDEFDVDESTLEMSVSKSTRKLYQDQFLLIDNKVRICLNDFRNIFNGSFVTGFGEPPLHGALKITTLVCNVISLVCLFLTFITYCVFPAMRSLPGMNNMSLVFAMFFAQLLFQCGFYITSAPTLCIVFGVLIHIFWLSTFGCMNVCSFHMYSVFAGDMMAGRLSAWNWKRRISLYILYSYGLSAAIVFINIIVVYLTSHDNNIGYGETRCFISNNVSFYLTFLAPVLIICFSNVYFFIKTAIQIKNSPKVDSTKERRNQYVIYVKLFSVTGITWILLVVDTLFPVSVFSFLVTIATACQGLFVLASFVLNRRVFSYYTVLVFGKKQRYTTSSNSQPGNTQSTTANSSSL
ncbi:uncharacterized protein LOC110464396 [Mizuhopecten yessoensis]|uniref:Latrophilin-3 n=1 Tax=Mizuhopecten yessoensis TaxID=6573 RepID=A0A210PTW6_MIZYE|nr:uncharacterized protein LOC110464396 [Mizuhopecten yessoensis]OWF39941.1 Latrophilin-3 [Mizuhopecten yessoensis]